MSSGICKNEKEEKKRENSSVFNFWIYFGIIILAILFIIIIISIIYSFFQKKDENNIIKSIKTPSKSTPSFEMSNLSTFQNIPSLSPPPPPTKITTENISSTKQPFLSNLMTETTKNTDKAFNTIISPLYNRKIPVKKGGFRCMYRRRF
jgi:cytoskeletal protein RodZ